MTDSIQEKRCWLAYNVTMKTLVGVFDDIEKAEQKAKETARQRVGDVIATFEMANSYKAEVGVQTVYLPWPMAEDAAPEKPTLRAVPDADV